MSDSPYLKFLKEGRRAPFSGKTWPPPRGEWVIAEPPVRMCVSGIHACRVEHLAYWLNQELWLMDVQGIVGEDHSKVVAERGRLDVPVGAWDSHAVVAFARQCAERTRRGAVEILRRHGASDSADALQVAATQRAAASIAADLERGRLGREPVDAARYAGDALAAVAAISETEAADRVAPAAARAAALVSHIAGLTAARVDDYDAERHEHGLWLARELGLV